MSRPPQVDDRTAADFVRQLHEALPLYAPAPAADASGAQLIDGLTGVFGRFCEIVADRINRAPEKHHLAFLQMLGLANRPPQAAQVPLTFYLSAENTGPALVKQRTQVAAQPREGDAKPVLFETEHPLLVVPHKLNAMFALDGLHDTYTDLSHLLPQAPPAAGASSATTLLPPQPAFTGSSPMPHRLYIALGIASPPRLPLDGLRLRFDVQPPPRTSAKRPPSVTPRIEWRLLIPHAPAATAPTESITDPGSMLASADVLLPTEDTSNGLTQAGELFFAKVPPSPRLTLTGDSQYWIEGRLLTPIFAAGTSEPEHLDPANLPTLKQVTAAWEVSGSALKLDQGFVNAVAVDLTKDFFPFGESPKFGDTLYLASNQLFSRAGVDITLSIEITNPAEGNTSPLPATAPNKAGLAWEFFDGASWSPIGFSGEASHTHFLQASDDTAAEDSFADNTNTFSSDGEVTFRLPRPPFPTTVNGKGNYWIRVRLAAGNYGAGPHHDGKNNFVPASYAPPVIHSLQARFAIAQETAPLSLVSFNNFLYKPESAAEPFQPFTSTPAEDAHPSLYFGFAEPASSARPTNPVAVHSSHRFPTEPMSLYLHIEQSERGISSAASANARVIRWEYWNGNAWADCTLFDGTGGLRYPGILRFIAPASFQSGTRFGLSRYWLRATPADPSYQATVSSALLNTVLASGCSSLLNEVLGVSSGEPGQTFVLLQSPFLTGQQLDVFEPHLPAKSEQDTIRREEGDDAFEVLAHTTPTPGVRVRWHRVDNFFASSPRDRHYLLDPLTGAVTFGNGTAGQIPPRGAKIVMSLYRIGGGAVSNRPALNITQMKTAVPYIDKACNWFAADGGGDIEDTHSVKARGARSLRHRNRAATSQDFEDLALRASPQVARAKCVPARDLLEAAESAIHTPGAVTVIVLPRTSDPRPTPGTQLLECVLGSLQAACLPTIQVVVTAPAYLQVNVTAAIVIDNPDKASQIQTAVHAAITDFLHPLTGGLHGSGWSFGHRPHDSQFYTCIERIPGVRYIRDVRHEFIGLPRQRGRNLLLVSAGNIQIESSLEP